MFSESKLSELIECIVENISIINNNDTKCNLVIKKFMSNLYKSLYRNFKYINNTDQLNESESIVTSIKSALNTLQKRSSNVAFREGDGNDGPLHIAVLNRKPFQAPVKYIKTAKPEDPKKLFRFACKKILVC